MKRSAPLLLGQPAEPQERRRPAVVGERQELQRGEPRASDGGEVPTPSAFGTSRVGNDGQAWQDTQEHAAERVEDVRVAGDVARAVEVSDRPPAGERSNEEAPQPVTVDDRRLPCLAQTSKASRSCQDFPQPASGVRNGNHVDLDRQREVVLVRSRGDPDLPPPGLEPLDLFEDCTTEAPAEAVRDDQKTSIAGHSGPRPCRPSGTRNAGITSSLRLCPAPPSTPSLECRNESLRTQRLRA